MGLVAGSACSDSSEKCPRRYVPAAYENPAQYAGVGPTLSAESQSLSFAVLECLVHEYQYSLLKIGIVPCYYQ